MAFLYKYKSSLIQDYIGFTHYYSASPPINIKTVLCIPADRIVWCCIGHDQYCCILQSRKCLVNVAFLVVLIKQDCQGNPMSIQRATYLSSQMIWAIRRVFFSPGAVVNAAADVAIIVVCLFVFC